MADPRKPSIKKSIRNRVVLLYILFLAVGVAIAGKIIYLQYGPESKELRAQAEESAYDFKSQEAHRGDILARDGRLLATSVPEYEVRMDFAADGLDDSLFYKNVDSLAEALANFFGDRTKSVYLDLLKRAHANRERYKKIAPRRVNYFEREEIAQFPIWREGRNGGGIILEQKSKRVTGMASRTIGYAKESGDSVGIEKAFDNKLRGTEGNVLKQHISGDFWERVSDPRNVDPVDGIDVVTTLDMELQDIAETELRKQLKKEGADWGTAILMEVSTGEVRAIANLTRNRAGEFVEDYNYAIGPYGNLEPGSTFKLASLITLLDEGKASLEEHFDTGNGPMKIGGRIVTDSHECGDATLRELFEQSSNKGFALAVNKYYGEDPDRFVKHLHQMGLDKPLDLRIPGGEDPNIDSTISRVTLTSMSFGYALKLTPLKTLSFYNAVANNGTMMRPIFVKELRQQGQTVKTFTPDDMMDHSIASPEVIAQVQEALCGVVNDGTAKDVLRKSNCSVAAKTGTAQIARGNRGYQDSSGGHDYLATMVGYFPADNPRYSCIVAIKTYHGPGHYDGRYYGASLAGPVFCEIINRVYASDLSWQRPLSEQQGKADKAPVLKSGRADEVHCVAKQFDVPYTKIKGAQWQYFTKLDSTGMELASLDQDCSGRVPQVVGMGLKEAIYLLEREGLRVEFSGTGYVRHQSLKAGTPVQSGALVVLQLGIEQPKVSSQEVTS